MSVRMITLAGAVLQVALVVAVWGGLSLLLDLDPVDNPDAGPLPAPLAVVASAGVVAAAVRWRMPGPAAAIFGALAALVAMAVVFGLALLLGGSAPGPAAIGALDGLLRPFLPAAAVTAGVSIGVGRAWVIYERKQQNER